MKTFPVLILTLAGVHCAMVHGPGIVTGLVGHTVTIPCRYGMLHRQRVKYWCKGRLRSSCVKRASTDGSVTDSRVSIRDDKKARVFYVTMTSLMMKDEGWYQCAIKRPILVIDDSHNVYLNITVGNETDLDTVVPTTVRLRTTLAAKPDTRDSSVGGVWAVFRWVLFSLMLACFLMVTWWKRSTCREPARPAARPLQGSDSTPCLISSGTQAVAIELR